MNEVCQGFFKVQGYCTYVLYLACLKDLVVVGNHQGDSWSWLTRSVTALYTTWPLRQPRPLKMWLS